MRVLLALVLCSAAVHAFASPETLGSFQHTAFQKQEGAPGDISHLAQTSDGFLWIAGTKGLTRFDGVTFAPFKPLPGERFLQSQFNWIFPAQGGGLWIANDNAGPTLLRDGHLTHFGEQQGYVGRAGYFFTDPHGEVWSVSSDAIMVFANGAWHAIERAQQPDRMYITGAFDAAGNLWVTASHQRLRVRAAGSDAFVDVPESVEAARRVFIGPSGRLYVTTSQGVHVYRAQGTRLSEVMLPIPFFVIAGVETRGGGLWLTSLSDGVYYASPEALAKAERDHAAPAMQKVPRIDGFPWPLLEDNEGDVWLGRGGGLDRFRRTAFTEVPLPDNIHDVNAAIDAQGNAWIGSESYRVLRVPAGGGAWDVTDVPQYTMATFTDPSDGTVWGANVTGVWQLVPGVPHLAIPLPPPHPATDTYCLVRDRQGRFFVSRARNGHGLLAWDGSSWRDVLDMPAEVTVMAVDARNHVWAGTQERNRLIEVSDGETHRWDEHAQLAVGTVKSLLVDGGRLWVGGDDGIQFFDGQRFVTLRANDADAFQTTTGMVKDGAGNLWVQTLDGVMRIPAADIQHAIEAPGTPVSYRLFDSADGVPGAPDPIYTLPTLRTYADGRIWAHTAQGLAWIDPASPPRSTAVPAIRIESVSADGADVPLTGERASLSAGQRSFRVAYTTPLLSHPERVNFFYRLAGFSDWQDAGHRREAVFTNVPPGDYRFEVRASGGGDVEGGATATLPLTRVPAYYETWWFRALALLPVALLLWMAYVARTRAIRRQWLIRVEEREAVARDLHDTLLQRFHGLILRLETWASDPAIPHGLRRDMAQLSDRTRDAVVEGRERILMLRRKDDDLALYDNLLKEGRALEAAHGSAFSIDIQGDVVALRPMCRRELHDFALEAMRNAFRHAQGSHVAVSLNYRRDALWLVVTDDGRGFGAEDTQRARRDGHYGIVGLHERAARLNATLNIDSVPGDGTEIHLRIPSRTAYARRRRASAQT